MKIKGKRVIITDEASEFANTMRGQYIISQALVLAHKVLEGYERELDRRIDEGKEMKDETDPDSYENKSEKFGKYEDNLETDQVTTDETEFREWEGIEDDWEEFNRKKNTQKKHS